jgi:hypothetical protein
VAVDDDSRHISKRVEHYVEDSGVEPGEAMIWWSVSRVAPNAVPVVACMQEKMPHDTPQESPTILKAELLGDALGPHTERSAQDRAQ